MSGRLYIRKRRRSSFRPALITVVTATVLLWGGVLSRGGHHRVAPQPASTTFARRSQSGLVPAIFRELVRPVYPYSIIRGGVYSAEELISALRADPTAAGHYGAFHLDRLRTVSSTFAAPVYLSYRKENVIFWTSHRIYLHQGETLLTDGSSYARARCGNRVSFVPQLPVAKIEPPPELLDVPEVPETTLRPLLQASVELDTATSQDLWAGQDLWASPEDVTAAVSRQAEPDDMSEGFGINGLGINWWMFTTTRKAKRLPEGELLLALSTIPAVPEPVPEPSGFILAGVIAGAFTLVRLGQHLKKNVALPLRASSL